MNFKGKTAVITGSGRGLGKKLACQYAEKGANVVITARSTNEIKEVSKDINENYEGNALPVTADVTVEEDVKKLVDKTVTKYGSVDILINNAAIHKSVPVLETDVSTWRKIIDVNLTGGFICAREFGRIMKEKKDGTIINISSTAADTYFPGFGAYSASKAGMIGFSRVLAEELGDYNINVITVKLGLVNTAYTRSRIEEGNPEDWIQPEEAGNVILYLSSEKANIITGTTVDITGNRK